MIEKDSLRDRAISRLETGLIDVTVLSDGEKSELIEELQIHQAELLIQNEELREVTQSLDESRSALGQSVKRYQSLFQYAPVGLCTLDRNNIIESANATFVEIVGVKAEKILNHPLITFVVERYRAVLSHLLNSKDLEAPGQEISLLTASGDEVVAEMRSRPFIGEGQLKLIVAIDITASKKAQRDLKAARKEAEVASQAKSDFLANMSHELRTPLTTIIGNIEFLAESEQDVGRREHIEAIDVAARTQLVLINDLLDISKIESGKFTIEQQPYDLSDLIHEIDKIFHNRVEDRGLRWVVENRCGGHQVLIGDKVRIQQILVNLLGNAIKFTEQGEIALAIEAAHGKLIFSVADSGVGMSPDALNRLFQRFVQADGSTSRQFGGTGLGLYISQELARLMGGEISASSISGKGSMFTFTMPYMVGNDLVGSDKFNGFSRAADTADSNEVFTGHVLVAEDTPAIQMLVRRMLEKLGLEVTTASNGLEAVERVCDDHSINLILMDMQMPEMDGISATIELKKRGCNIPVVALTANVMQRHRDAFSEAGITGFLEKPINRADLSLVLSRHLKRDSNETRSS